MIPFLRYTVIGFLVEGYGYFEYTSHIVDDDIQRLLGLKIQPQLRATTVKNDNGLDYIEFPILFRLPLTFKRGHLFYEFPANEVLFSETELYKLHRNLGHSSAETTFKTLERAYPIEKTQDKKKAGQTG